MINGHLSIPASFPSLKAFFEYDSMYTQLALQLKSIISMALPNSEIRLKWGMPMWVSKANCKNMCYLGYSKNQITDRYELILGFPYGYKMFDNHNLFDKTNHAQIRKIKITKEKVTNIKYVELLKDYLHQTQDLTHNNWI